MSDSAWSLCLWWESWGGEDILEIACLNNLWLKRDKLKKRGDMCVLKGNDMSSVCVCVCGAVGAPIRAVMLTDISRPWSAGWWIMTHPEDYRVSTHTLSLVYTPGRFHRGGVHTRNQKYFCQSNNCVTRHQDSLISVGFKTSVIRAVTVNVQLL